MMYNKIDKNITPVTRNRVATVTPPAMAPRETVSLWETVCEHKETLQSYARLL